MRADRRRHLTEPDRAGQAPSGRPARIPAALGPGALAAGLARPTSPGAALALQRTIGNAAFTRLVERERHEHGADCGHADAVQRFDDDQAVQRAALDRVDAVTRGGGSPMPTDVQRRMESEYGGEDFGEVRLHVDRASADAVGAKAYTTRTNHIVFRSPADMDDHTMRHELQHVRQQRAGGVPSGVSHPGDALERDAESTAVRLGQGATAAMDGVQRSTAASGAGVVQRVTKISPDLYKGWAGDGAALTSPQKTWVWNKLTGIRNAAALKNMKTPQALELLAEHHITRELMNAELGTGASAAAASTVTTTDTMEQFEAQARTQVDEADRIWRVNQPEMPQLQTVAFEVEGLGRGVVALLKSATGTRHPNMLSWFSHGYQDQNTIAIDTKRQYGFAVEERKSLNRVGATADAFASLPAALAASGTEATGAAPGVYVRPHHPTELAVEIDRVVGLVGESDVAVMLDFVWSNQVAERFTEARKAETPPLPVIIEEAGAFSGYSSLLVYACRTPWSVNAAAEGSSKLRTARENELKAEGKSIEDAKRMAEEEYVGSPQTGRVHQ